MNEPYAHLENDISVLTPLFFVSLDKEQDVTRNLRVLQVLEVHKVLQDLESKGERPTQASSLSQRYNLPRETDLS